MPSSADERHLRRLLAVRVAMPHTYFDDGEAQGQEHGISIDFMREPVADIDAKLRSLNVARAECRNSVQPQHVCALQGLGTLGDECPACKAPPVNLDLEQKWQKRATHVGSPWNHLEDVLPVLTAARAGEWHWTNNFRFKYMELRIDMRDGGCIIKDRDGNRVAPSELLRNQKKAQDEEGGNSSRITVSREDKSLRALHDLLCPLLKNAETHVLGAVAYQIGNRLVTMSDGRLGEVQETFVLVPMHALGEALSK